MSEETVEYCPPRLAAAPSEVTTDAPSLIRQRGRHGLQLLLEAYDYASQLPCNTWEFALDVKSLLQGGLSPNDLRWLLCKGLLDHGFETTSLGQEKRTFRPGGSRRFSRASCFVLTEAGVAFARQVQPIDPPRYVVNLQNGNGHPHSTRPIWDHDRQELRLGARVVKRFKAPAPNQELILAAFEEEGWPVHIDDPLPPHPDQEPRRRLHDTINSLNRNQKASLIRFIGDGSGQGIRWELTEPAGEQDLS